VEKVAEKDAPLLMRQIEPSKTATVASVMENPYGSQRSAGE
jgi:hypothetical protein